MSERSSAPIALPRPRGTSETSVETALAARRSIREYDGAPLTSAALGQLLWAAQGVTDARGCRAAPSAGALFPLEVYAAVGAVEGIGAGVYRYLPDRHALAGVADGDRRFALASAALGQEWIAAAPAALVLAAVYERTTGKYGERGVRYVHMEVGLAAANVYLQATALGLCTTMVGAFEDDAVRRLVGLRPAEHSQAILPVGRPAGPA